MSTNTRPYYRMIAMHRAAQTPDCKICGGLLGDIRYDIPHTHSHALSMHMVIPAAAGGDRKDLSLYVTSHRWCNTALSDKQDVEWLRARVRNGHRPGRIPPRTHAPRANNARRDTQTNTEWIDDGSMTI